METSKQAVQPRSFTVHVVGRKSRVTHFNTPLKYTLSKNKRWAVQHCLNSSLPSVSDCIYSDFVSCSSIRLLHRTVPVLFGVGV